MKDTDEGVSIQEEDPIWDLGSNPVNCDLPDASSQPDQYLYGFDEPTSKGSAALDEP